jgi:hypothetical protein
MTAWLSTRITALLSLAVVTLAAASSASAAFTADLNLTGNLADPAHVQKGDPVTITVGCSWTANASNPGDNITRIQLNWSNSDSALSLPTAGTWAWNTATDGINSIGDSDLSDGKVNRQGLGITPPASFTIGTLSFNAPLTEGTYALNLTGGSLGGGTASVVADGTTYLYAGNDLTMGTYSFTVVPEPATLALLAFGGLAFLRHRQKAH